MSATAYAGYPTATQPQRETHPRHIEIVTSRQQRKARPRLVYALVTIASLGLIFAAQLGLSFVVSDGAYQISALQAQQRDLQRVEQDLIEKLSIQSAPQNLAAQATWLGMVPNAAPLSIDLGSGTIFALPGSADPTGCAGTCNLVTNTLTAGIGQISPVAPVATTRSAQTATTAPAVTAPAGPAVVDALPAPVTH